MKKKGVEEVYKKLLEYNKIDKISDESKRTTYEENLKEFVDDLFNLSKNAVAPLTEKQTFILRKQYGIFDEGIMQSQTQIGKELGGLSRSAINQMVMRINKIIPYRIRRERQEELGFNIFDVFQDKSELSDMAIGELQLSPFYTNKLAMVEIFTLGDLMRYNSGELHFLIGDGSGLTELIQKVHDLGLRFIDELTDHERKALFERESSPEKLLNTNLNWLGISMVLEKQLKNMGIYKLGDLRTIKINSSELDGKLKQLGIDNIDILSQKSDENIEIDEFEKRILGISLDDLFRSNGLSVRPYNALKRMGINTMSELVAMTIPSLFGINNLGEKSCNEIIDIVHSYGLRFADELDVIGLIQSNKGALLSSEYVSALGDSQLNEQREKVLSLSLEQLNFSKRVYNCLTRMGLVTLQDLLSLSTRDLRKIRNLGVLSRDEIIDKIHGYGLRFADEQEPKVIVNDSPKEGTKILREESDLLASGIERKTYLVERYKKLTEVRGDLLAQMAILDEEITNILCELTSVSKGEENGKQKAKNNRGNKGNRKSNGGSNN